MWPFKTLEPPKLTGEEALKELDSFIVELDSGWERDGLDWAPALLGLLRDFNREAAAENPDRERLGILHAQVHAFFKDRHFLKGLPSVLWDIDIIYRNDA
jgi:hypothetical protein